MSIVDTDAFSTFITVLGTGLMGAIGWVFVRGVNLATRVSVVETQHKDLLTLINTRFDSVDQRLSRIERSMNGNLKD